MTKASEKSKIKLTDVERHKRFVDMAKELEASHDRSAFDGAFERVTLKSQLEKHAPKPPIKKMPD